VRRKVQRLQCLAVDTNVHAEWTREQLATVVDRDQFRCVDSRVPSRGNRTGFAADGGEVLRMIAGHAED